MSKLRRNAMMRRSIPFIAMVVAVGSASVLATERDALQSHAYREDLQRRWPHEGKPLRFKAPPSQLLDYPFAGVRLMPPLRPAPAPRLTGELAAGEPVPGAPPSQLPRISEPAYQLYFFLER